jgi:hypothetical protein
MFVHRTGSFVRIKDWPRKGQYWCGVILSYAVKHRKIQYEVKLHNANCNWIYTPLGSPYWFKPSEIKIISRKAYQEFLDLCAVEEIVDS